MTLTAEVYTVLAVLAVLLNIDGTNSNQHDTPNFQADKLDTFIKHTMQCNNVTGLSVSLVKGNKTAFSRGYGHTNVQEGIKATHRSEFCIGSLTKAFTSTIIADILSKHDNLTWDTPIRDILGPSFHLSDNLRTNHVTLRDLLAHKVGVPSNFNALLVGFPSNMSREELVRKLQYMPATSDFRNKFHYSNYMYMLAGHVAEVLTGKSWENMVTDRLLSKLKMHSTGFVDKLPTLDNIASPYAQKNWTVYPLDKRLLLSVSPSGPAGSITSTASDMAKWMQFHLHRGRNIHGVQLVDEDWLDETYRSQMTNPFGENDLSLPTFPISDTSVSYNMGWMSSSYRGYRKLWHSGGIVSFTSQLWLFPDMNSGVFVASNGPIPAKAAKNIVFYASDLLLGLEPWLNTSTTCTYPAPWKKPNVVLPANQVQEHKWNISKTPRDYEGTYGHLGFGEIKVYVHDDTYLELDYGRFGQMKLFPINETLFIGYFKDKLWFITGSDGNIEPYKINFVIDNGKITRVLFPIDFNEHPTVFLKGDMYNSRTVVQTAETISCTSTMCSSGISKASVITCSRLGLVAFLFIFVICI